MTAPTGSASTEPDERTPPLGRLFVLIVVVEILTVASLYWFGRHFA